MILTHAPEFSGRITFDEFARSVAVDGTPITDGSPIRIKAQPERDWIQDKIPTTDVHEALTVVAESAAIHPVRSYLQSLKWDSILRIDSFFEDHLDCLRDPYHMAVARYLFLSAVSRILRPGCKADMMVILESSQGQGKSSLWQTLAGERWYADITASINNKDFLTGLRGVWFADLGELDQFSRAESSRIKQVISIGTDHYLLIHADVSIAEILSDCLKIEIGRQTRSEQTRVGNILVRMKWRKIRNLDDPKPEASTDLAAIAADYRSRAKR